MHLRCAAQRGLSICRTRPYTGFWDKPMPTTSSSRRDRDSSNKELAQLQSCFLSAEREWGDGQTDRQATLHRSAGITWVTDGRTNPCVSGRPDGQTAARCPASSRPHIVCPQAPSCGRCSLEELKWEATPWHGSRRAWIHSALPAWESSRGGRARTCRHPGYPALPPSA